MYACLAVTCHLHFWQNDRDFLRATVVTRGLTDTEIRVSTESRPWRRKFSRRSSRDSNPRPFNHESGALTTELSPPLILGMKTLPITINNFSGILLVVYCIELLCSGLLVLCSWPFQTFVLLCVWCRLFNVRIFTQTVQTIKLQIMQNNPLSRNCLEMLLHLKKNS